ncbi:MAG TPA: HPr family phosphocarrier protein [Clostridiaceae bacterium]|nr:HPr family phosphocarrier protein [Clostridiaceae bacterium]
MIEKNVLVDNPTGLNAKTAALLVQVAGKFSSNIWIKKEDKRVNAKSIIALMSLAISKGTDITIEAEGEDEQLAINELTELFQFGLGD